MTLRTIFLLTISISSFGQINQDDLKQRIKLTANQMGQLFLIGDYNKFADYMYPKAVEKMGGKDRIVKALVDGNEKMESDGIKVKSIDFDDPSDILENAKTLQCIMPQILKLKVKGGTLVTKASLFAISEDNGQSWTFIDVSRKSYDQIKSMIPIFHPRLEILNWTEPTFIPD